jgi:hypothetical protein
MVRIFIAAATFLAMCSITLANAAAAESQRTAATTAPAAAPIVQVYSNPG